MKTKLKKLSKRTVSVILCLAMLVSIAILGIVNVSAYNAYAKGKIYFAMPYTWTDNNSSVQYCIVKKDSSRVQPKVTLTKIANTDLYYGSGDFSSTTYGDEFDRAEIIANASGWGDFDSWNNASLSHYTNPIVYSCNNSSYYYRFYYSSTEQKGISVTTNSSTDRGTALQVTQKIYAYTDLTGGGTYSNDETGGKVVVSYKQLSNDNTASSQSFDTSTQSGSDYYTVPAEITLTATATSGYKFDGWFTAASGGSALTTNSSAGRTVNSNVLRYHAVTQDYAIYARFSLDETKYDVTPATHSNDSIGTGSVTPPTAQQAGSITTATFKADPSGNNSKFVDWTLGDGITLAGGSTTDASITVNASKAGTVTANFAENDKRTITIASAQHGSISLTGSTVTGNIGAHTSGSFQAYVGDEITLTATPDTDYKLSNVNVEGATYNTSTQKFTVGANNITVTPTFSAKTYTTVSFKVPGGNGTVSVREGTAGTVTTITDSKKTLTLDDDLTYYVMYAADSGYAIDKVCTNTDTSTDIKSSFSTSYQTLDKATYANKTLFFYFAENLGTETTYKILTGTDPGDSALTDSGATVYEKNGVYSAKIYPKNITSGLTAFSKTTYYFALSTSTSVSNIVKQKQVNNDWPAHIFGTSITSDSTDYLKDSNDGEYGYGSDSPKKRYYYTYVTVKDTGFDYILVQFKYSTTSDSTTNNTCSFTAGKVAVAADPFYIGGRITVAPDGTDISAGTSIWNFNANSTNIKIDEPASGTEWTFDTGKTISELSPIPNYDETTGVSTGTSTGQYFLLHDKQNKYITETANAGREFQLADSQANAVKLVPIDMTANPVETNELRFNDASNGHNGSVILHVDASNYHSDDEEHSYLYVWYTLDHDHIPAVDGFSLVASPNTETAGKSITLNAVGTKLNIPARNLEYKFYEYNSASDRDSDEDLSNGTLLATIPASDLANPLMATYMVTNGDASTDTAIIKYYKAIAHNTLEDPDPEQEFVDVVRTDNARWNPLSLYVTDNDISAANAKPTWHEITRANPLYSKALPLSSESDIYTFALSNESTYTQFTYTIDDSMCKYASISPVTKTVTIDGKRTAITVYQVKLNNSQCSEATLYVDRANSKMYVIGKYSHKYVSDSKTITYYFAERVGNESRSDPSTNGANNHDGMRISYWNNNTGTYTATNYVDITTPVNKNSSNTIYVYTNEFYTARYDQTLTGEQEFKIYKAELPVTATSFRFVKKDGSGFNAEKINNIKEYGWDQVNALNPNRVYLLYRDNNNTIDDNDWRVKGVILSDTLWTSGRGKNPDATEGFLTNLVNYKDIDTIGDPSSKTVNTALSALYSSTANGKQKTPIPLYFGNFYGVDSSSLYNYKKKWNLAQSGNDKSYWAAVWNLVGDTVSATEKNANGFGKLQDTVALSSSGAPQINPLFDYDNLGTAADLVKQGLKFPFNKSEYNGITTYSFDSTTDFNRKYNTTSQKLEVQTGTGNARYEIGYDTPKGSTQMPYTGLFPFGGNTNQYDNTGFGMEFDINFYMTNTGKLLNSDNELEDITFNFSGDDDVWVYVDDVLVLDLGGDHKISAGSINFSEMKVYYKSTAKDANAITNNSDSYASTASYIKTVDLAELMEAYGKPFNNTDGTTKHTFQMFYLERGAFQSNCSISFNLPQASGLSVRNQIKSTDVNRGLVDAAMASANGDYFTYTVENRLATSTEVDAVKAKGGVLANAKDEATSLVSPANTPKFPSKSTIAYRNAYNDSYLLAHTGDTRPQVTSNQSFADNNGFKLFNNANYTLYDGFVNVAEGDGVITGRTNGTDGAFNLLTNQRAEFDDKVTNDSVVRVTQMQRMGGVKELSSNNNLIDYAVVPNNNSGKYYITSYDVYDEVNKVDAVGRTDLPVNFNNNFVAGGDASGVTDGFYFSNYTTDQVETGAQVPNAAMTVNFYNEIAVGDIYIEKVVDANSNANDTFVFKLEFDSVFGDDSSSWEEYDIDYYRCDGPTKIVKDREPVPYGEVGIILHAGEAALIKGVPVETHYKVTEVQQPGYSLQDIDKYTTKSNGSAISDTNNLGEGFYNEMNQGSASYTSKDVSNPVSESETIGGVSYSSTHTYYTNMIPDVRETYIDSSTSYMSKSYVVYNNKKEEFSIVFKYYDRSEIDGSPSSIANSEKTYGVSVDNIGEYTYWDNPVAKEGFRKIDFEKLISDYIADNSASMGVSNLVDNYRVFFSQADAVDKLSKIKNLQDSQGKTYTADQLKYHTDYVGNPVKYVTVEGKDYYADSEGKSTGTLVTQDNWVTYIDSENNVVPESVLTTEDGSGHRDYSKNSHIQSITVWLYNEPKQYNVNVYGAKQFTDLQTGAKTVNGHTVYVANSSTTENKIVDKKVYYNQRLGVATGIEQTDSSSGFLDNYMIPSFNGDVQPQNTISMSFTNDSDTYHFAYWALDPEGTQIASTSKYYFYRISKNTDLYAVYTIGDETVSRGVSLTANENDTYIDEDVNHTPRTRLNMLMSIYDCVNYDPNIKKVSFFNISLSQTVAANPDVYTPAVINDMFEKYKDQLLTLIKTNENSKSFNASQYYTGTPMSGLEQNAYNLTLTTKGFVYTVTDKITDAMAREGGYAVLTNKNRVQFTMDYKTSAVAKPATTLVFAGAMLYDDGNPDTTNDWVLTNNCLIYRNAQVFNNTDSNWGSLSA